MTHIAIHLLTDVIQLIEFILSNSFFAKSKRKQCTDCKGGNLIQCHSTDDNFCISNTLKSDGIHNCIPPSNADEPDKPFPIYGENAERKMEEWQNETEWQRKKTGGATQIYSMSCLFYLITVASLAFSTM